MYYFHRPALLKKSLFKRTLKTLTGVFVLKVGISATLLALATTANSAGTQVAPFTYGSWQTSSAEELDLPNLRGQGLSFAEQYENKFKAYYTYEKGKNYTFLLIKIENVDLYKNQIKIW